MHVFLTGATGLIGSGVLSALLADGHQVTALARSDASAALLERAGASVVHGDVSDPAAVAAAGARADGVIHTASTPEGDPGVLDALLRLLAGSNRPLIHTSGIWTFGAGDLDEDSPTDAGCLPGWRLPLDARVRAANEAGIRTVIVAPGIVYGRGMGIPRLLRQAPRRNGSLLIPGSGAQRWPTVHTSDLGRLYARALTDAPAGSYYLAASNNQSVGAIGRSASLGLGGNGMVASTTPEEAEAIYGPLAPALLLDQRVTSARARRELGWQPSEVSLLDDLQAGSYVEG